MISCDFSLLSRWSFISVTSSPPSLVMNGMTATCFTTYSIQVSLVDEYAYRRPGRVLAYEVFAEFMAGGMGSSLTLWCDVAVDDGIGGGVGGGCFTTGPVIMDWSTTQLGATAPAFTIQQSNTSQEADQGTVSLPSLAQDDATVSSQPSLSLQRCLNKFVLTSMHSYRHRRSLQREI